MRLEGKTAVITGASGGISGDDLGIDGAVAATSEDVAEVAVFVLERPRRLRLLELAFRPATEPSWG